MSLSIDQFPAESLVSRLKANRLMLAFVVLGFLPLLWNFFALSWERPAYQFFPMAFLAAGMLAWRAAGQIGTTATPGGLRMTRYLALATVLLWLVANVLWSPWLGYMTFLIGLTCTLCGLGGRPLLKAFLPVGLILVAIVPPPFGLDEVLTLKLRVLATNWSSGLLDWLQVTHLQDGNTIQLPGKTLLMDEACSGIYSFVLCNVFCLFWLLWQRRPFLWLLLALPVTSAFVVLGNTLRITTCAAADYFWHLDLLHGWQHQTFGLVLLMGYCGLVLSLDQLLLFLLGAPAAPGGTARTSPSRPAGPLRSHPLFGFRYAGLFLALVGLGFFAAHVVRQGASHALTRVRIFNSSTELDLTMPSTLAGWTRVNSNVGDAILVETLGIHSQSWRYELAGESITVAADYPLDGFHNVSMCYVNNGWQVESESQLLLGPDHQDTHAFKLALEKSHQHAVVFHSVMTATGAWLSAPKSFEARFADNSPPTGYRIQLISAGDGNGYLPMSQATESRIINFYLAARQLLAAQLLEQLAGPHAK